MDLTRIRIVGLQVVDLPVVLAHPSDEFQLKAADGLGPTPVTVGISGGTFQSLRAEDRELIFRIGLQPDYKQNHTPSSLREILYSMLAPASTDGSIEVQFLQSDRIVASVRGWVSKMEPVLFGKDPEVQITIETNEPYLSAPNDVTVVPASRVNFTVSNLGTAPSWFEASLTLTSDAASWILYLESMKIQFKYSFKTGDRLIFNTDEDNRSVTLVRNGAEIILIDAVTQDSKWLRLHAGKNSFSTSNLSFTWNYIRYRPKFLGV